MLGDKCLYMRVNYDITFNFLVNEGMISYSMDECWVVMFYL